MGISKALSNPQGFNQQMSPEDLINMDGVNAVYDDGSVDVSFGEDSMQGEDLLDQDLMEEIQESIEEKFSENLVEYFDEEELTDLGESVVDAFLSDQESRSEWEETLENGFGNLGLKPEKMDKPFEGACGAFHPLIIENAVKFQSKASNELLPARGPVKMQILGDVTVEKQQRATRKEKHMNWQTTTQMSEYYTDSERMLLFTALIGSGFKKVYYSSSLKRNISEFLSADQFVVPYGAPDLERAPRYTQILYKSKDEYIRDCAEGLYVDQDLGEPSKAELTVLRAKQDEILGITPSTNTYDYAYTFLEQHVNIYLKTDKDKFKIPKPYIITVDKGSGKVVGIRRNWEQGDLTYTKTQYFVHYQFIPGFGFNGFGLIHLLGNYQMTLTAVLRSLVDAGQLANVKGGFKLGAIRNEKGNLSKPLGMGEWRDIETGGVPIKDALFPMQYGEPSSVLMSMLEYLENRGQKFADSTEQIVADSASYGPVGTTLALLDASAKFFSALHKRLHASQKKELGLLSILNSKFLDEMNEFKVPGKSYEITREDYLDIDTNCIPVSDPNIPSKAYLLSITQNKMQMLQQVPALQNVINMREMARRCLAAMDEENIDELIVPEEKAQPLDPVSDILASSNGKPIQAFEGQDHDAHIAVKTSWLQDPMNGASPVMQPFAAAIQANIREHMLLKYKEQMAGLAKEQQMQGAIEQVQAQAAQQIMQANANVQTQGSPEMILAQSEMMRAQNDVRKQQHTEQRDAAKLALEANKQRVEMIKEDNRHNETLNDAARASEELNMKLGADMINKNLDRVNKNAVAKAKQDVKQSNTPV